MKHFCLLQPKHCHGPWARGSIISLWPVHISTCMCITFSGVCEDIMAEGHAQLRIYTEDDKVQQFETTHSMEQVVFEVLHMKLSHVELQGFDLIFLEEFHI